MTALDYYGIGSLALIALTFCFVRQIVVFAALGVTIAAGFALMTSDLINRQAPWEWIVLTVGMLACVFGLLTIRVMLVRSVSLRLLATFDGSRDASFGENLGARVQDMRTFHLTHTSDEGNRLTWFGQGVGAMVAVLYVLARIDA